MSAHIDSCWSGQVLSVAYKSAVYHFKRRGTGFYLDSIEHLNTGTTTSAGHVPIPGAVREELNNNNVRLIE